MHSIHGSFKTGTSKTANTSQRSRHGTPHTGKSSQQGPSEFKELKIETSPNVTPKAKESEGMFTKVMKKSESSLTLNAVKESVGKAASHNPSSLTVTGALVGSGIAAFGAGMGGNAIAAAGGTIGTLAALGQAGMEWQRGHQEAKKKEEREARRSRKKKTRRKKSSKKGGNKDKRDLESVLESLSERRSLGYGYHPVDAFLMARAMRLDRALRTREAQEESPSLWF